MKIIKKELTYQKLVVENDEPTIKDVTKTVYFCMTLWSQKKIEQTLNKRLVSIVQGQETAIDLMSTKVGGVVASACYFKVDGSKIIQNDATYDEFYSSDMLQIISDTDFILQLGTMIGDYFGFNAPKKHVNGAKGSSVKN